MIFASKIWRSRSRKWHKMTQTDRQAERKSQTCSWPSWASIASRRRSQWSRLRGKESGPNPLLLSSRSVTAEKRVKSGCKLPKQWDIHDTQLIKPQTSVKQLICGLAICLCFALASVSHVLLLKTNMQTFSSTTETTHPQYVPVVQADWAVIRSGGGYVAQLSRKPGQFSLLTSQTETLFTERTINSCFFLPLPLPKLSIKSRSWTSQSTSTPQCKTSARSLASHDWNTWKLMSVVLKDIFLSPDYSEDFSYY